MNFKIFKFCAEILMLPKECFHVYDLGVIFSCFLAMIFFLIINQMNLKKKTEHKIIQVNYILCFLNVIQK